MLPLLDLLLLISAVSAVTVPPPTNVDVSCQNVNIRVSWDHSKLQPQTSFRVRLLGSAGPYCESTTTDHWYDLGPCVWKESEDRYLDFLYVTVTAEQGGNQSKAVVSNTFSFHSLKTVHTRCALHFPPVTVIGDESRATVSFKNPFNFYKELKQTIKPNDDSRLQFTVTPVTTHATHVGEFKGLCTLEQDTCKVDVRFSEGVEDCVTMKGKFFVRKGIQQLAFMEDKICSSDSAGFNEEMLIIILMCVIGGIVIVVVISVCVSKAWTMQIPTLPKSLMPNHGEDACKYGYVPKEDISGISVSEPHKRLSVSSEDTSDPGNLRDISTGPDHNPPAESVQAERRRSEHSNQEPEAAEFISDGNRADDDSADDSLKTECTYTDLEEEREESVSGYDCPHAVMLDMGDGDIVTGYTGE